ncbi:RNA ligase family protein [Mesorhizobium sp.]|uniref:ATP-dependent DNA ligase n=1 Tax=Mesorhizobium sp. TaxID=1871066 RepID=UPI0011F84F77|nr:RNA ligase family protein [Mesorhizobium sp.]TIX28292.1 MAG: ATP-dependent DNA ligase [Mesorhizobium sp.]
MRSKAAGERLAFIEPMKPTLVLAPPAGDGWTHEVKFDGYRSQLIIDATGTRIHSSSGADWSLKYKPLVEAAKSLDVTSAIIDGEIILTNDAGLPDFKALRSAITRRPQDLYLVAFDLLHLNGHDLRNMACQDRREILQGLMPAGGRIQFSEALPGDAASIYALVDQAGLEGMVSKRTDSLYRSGPTQNWRKAKCFEIKTLDIIGVKRETGKRAVALLAAAGHYVGKATITMKGDIRKRLWDRVQGKADAPMPKGVPKGERAEWIKPGLSGRVKTLKGEDMLRHASMPDFREED